MQLVEEVEGIIRVYKDGYVERFSVVPSVSCAVASELGVVAKDAVIDKFTNLWARIYAPIRHGKPLPVVVYFHGGGFCVGSAAWGCYHDFLANLASKAGCVVISVNYRLAPENRLPAAYDDGRNAVLWVRQQALEGSGEQQWWLGRCHFSSLYLAGDSAGANIAHNVATRLSSDIGTVFLSPLCLKGTILIQPFFGGEARTQSEKLNQQPANSVLSLAASDAYWRLSLPAGAGRDHPWSNPLSKGAASCGVKSMMVCIAEMDILKDRNLEFCAAMAAEGKRVEKVVYRGVGHAFQILHNLKLSQARTQELMSHLKAFINQ